MSTLWSSLMVQPFQVIKPTVKVQSKSRSIWYMQERWSFNQVLHSDNGRFATHEFKFTTHVSGGGSEFTTHTSSNKNGKIRVCMYISAQLIMSHTNIYGKMFKLLIKRKLPLIIVIMLFDSYTRLCFMGFL